MSSIIQTYEVPLSAEGGHSHEGKLRKMLNLPINRNHLSNKLNYHYFVSVNIA